jgi:hypothetical protein
LSYLAIGWNVTKVLPLEEEMYLTEPRAISFVSFPAFTHEIIDLARTCRRTRQISLETIVLVPVVTVLYHLFASQFGERLLSAEHQDLP